MLGRVTLYTKRVPEMIAFYCDHFGYTVLQRAGDRITELRCPQGGPSLMLHAAAKGQKEGQVLVKLGFDVDDVATRRDLLIAAGVAVGPLHDGIGYHFANLKDPSKNSVSITNRHLVAP